MELFDDVFLNMRGSGCGKGHHGGTWEVLSQGCELAVFRSEVVSPLRDAVGFMDCDSMYLISLKEILEIFLKGSFWGSEEEAEFLRTEVGDDLSFFGGA